MLAATNHIAQKETLRKSNFRSAKMKTYSTSLFYGNRFLDLRVIFQHVAGSKEKFWISHGILRTNNSVRDVLTQVKRFLDNTNEIVIMDIHLFYMGLIDSWVEDRHKKLMNLIMELSDIT